MRLAVLSDLHLGFAYGTDRGEDAFKNAEEAFSKALAEKPNILLLLGDIFHDKIPKPEVLGKAIELFRAAKEGLKQAVKVVNIRKAGKESVENKSISPIIAIYGTHERRGGESTNPVHILEKAGLVFHLHGASAVIDTNGERIALHGLSGVPEQYARETLRSWNPSPIPGMPNILMLHQTFKELIPEVQQNVLSYSDLPEGFDLYLLGHIHWAVQDKHPILGTPILIPGSTIRTQLKKIEAKKKKGFYIIQLDKKIKEIRFIELEGVRKFHYEEIIVEGQRPSEIKQKLVERLTEIIKYHNAPHGPLVRFKLKGKLAEGFLPTDLNFSEIFKKFEGTVFLSIDKSNVLSSKLSERAKLLQDLKSQRISINQLGLKLLLKNLKIGDSKQAKKVEKLFELLAENKIDEAEKEL